MSDLFNSLNESQISAVTYNDGHHLIVAGAGSGKTRVLTTKIAYLIENGFEPESILALTFTNKAASEMKERIISLVGDEAKKIWMGTFHSILAKILRFESSKLNYNNNFSIYDKEDSVSLISTILSEVNISFDSLSNSSLHQKISLLKNQLIYPAEYEKDIASSALEKKIAKIYTEYNQRLFENNAMDFDDLIIKPIELFNSQSRILQKYRRQFKYILIDEYQDTNRAQYEVIKLLNFGKTIVSVVGDDSQSIYGWRGAEIKNMFDFEKDFPKSKVFRLEQNYRSTKTILKAADSVIKNNLERIEKTLWTENEEGEKIVVIRCVDEKDEAHQIARLVKKEITSKKLSLNDITILYRINSQSRALEEGFRKNSIPYKIIGGTEFYRRKEVKDIIAYLRILSNTNDEESLLRIMNFPQRGIGNTSITKMLQFSRKLDVTLFDTMSRVFEVIEVKERIQKNVKQFKAFLDKYIELKDKLSIGELTSAMVDELGILKLYKDEGTPEGNSRYENVMELISGIQEYSANNPNPNLDNFLAEVSLVSGVDQLNESENSITMMTLHNAKGLEFPIVFLSGCEEDIFPLNKKFESESELEEERRLFYVGLTRAKTKIYITYARSRYRFGEVAYQSRSRFIDELDKDTIFEVNEGNSRKGGRKKKEPQFDEFYQESYDDFDQERKSLRVGSRVSHELFGQGKILQINGAGDMQRVVVAFEDFGQKQLLTKVANLKVL